MKMKPLFLFVILSLLVWSLPLAMPVSAAPDRVFAGTSGTGSAFCVSKNGGVSVSCYILDRQ